MEQPVCIAHVSPIPTQNYDPLIMNAAFQTKLNSLLEHPRMQAAIITLILFNALLLGLETSTAIMDRYGELILSLDRFILVLFVIEIGARLYARGRAFWRDPWCLFDFAVVAIALLPATGQFAVLRALRVLRVLRLLTAVPALRRVVGALLSAIPGLGSIALVLVIIYYVFAVIATHLFGAAYPEWFGSLGGSFYTLFQIMTLESWSMGIVRPVMQQYPYAWAFFVPFILVATFTILNLFIAIIVSAMQTYTESEKQQTAQLITDARTHTEDDLHAEVCKLRHDIHELKQLLCVAAEQHHSLPENTLSSRGAKRSRL